MKEKRRFSVILFLLALLTGGSLIASCEEENGSDNLDDGGTLAEADEDGGSQVDTSEDGGSGTDTDTGLASGGCTPSEIVEIISRDNIYATLEELTSLPARTAYAGQQAALEMLEARLESYDVDYDLHTYDWQDHTWSNIEITIPGEDLADEIILAGGHYDSTSFFGAAPGADDNGSGTAAIVEIARHLSKCNFRRTIKLVLFSNEEKGLIGSEYYARDAVNNGDDIKGMLALDTIGFGPADEDLNVNTKTGMEWLANMVKEASDNEVGLPVVVEVDDQCG
jgi:Peptidase family M28